MDGACTSVFLDLLPGKPPLARCQATAGPDMSCEEQPDGSALLMWQERQPMRDGGVTGRGTSLFAADGCDVGVISYNAAEPKAFESSHPSHRCRSPSSSRPSPATSASGDCSQCWAWVATHVTNGRSSRQSSRTRSSSSGPIASASNP